LINCPNRTTFCCVTFCASCTTYLGVPLTTSCRPPTWVYVWDRHYCGPTHRPCVRLKTCAPCPHWSRYWLLTANCFADHMCQTCWVTPEIPVPRNRIVSVVRAGIR
jgi:hypothetical protein